MANTCVQDWVFEPGLAPEIAQRESLGAIGARLKEMHAQGGRTQSICMIPVHLRVPL